MTYQRRGRPPRTDKIFIIPKLRDQPDVAKLGRALIRLAQKMEEEKPAETIVPTHKDTADSKENNHV